MEALSGGLPIEDLAGTLVEHLLVGAELLIRDQGEVGAFGEVVADSRDARRQFHRSEPLK